MAIILVVLRLVRRRRVQARDLRLHRTDGRGLLLPGDQGFHALDQFLAHVGEMLESAFGASADGPLVARHDPVAEEVDAVAVHALPELKHQGHHRVGAKIG